MSQLLSAVTATGLLLAPGILSAEEARLVDACSKHQVGARAPDPYCRWVVRLAPAAAGTRNRAAAANAAEERAIRAVIAPLNAIQPTQIESERAGVLAEKLGSATGEFVIVSLIKHNGTWQVDSVTLVPRWAERP
jgi:hypothetical protein